jgi:peptidoglycan-associated lipoprotein
MNLLRLITCLSISLILALPAVAQKNFAKDADLAFRNEAYFTAKDLYKKAYPKVPKAEEKARIIFQIAECYRLLTDANQAEVWYSKAIKSKYKDPTVRLRLAEVLKEQGKYAEALKEYNKYSSEVPGDARAAAGASACELAQKWKDNPTRLEVDPEVLLNSKQYDFSPTFADKKGREIYFTSSREAASGSGTDERTGESFSDIFSATIDKKGKWSEPTPLVGEYVNSEHNEGAVAMDKKKSTLYFTRCPNEAKQNLGCDIWYAAKKGQAWGEAIKMSLKPEVDGADTLSVGHPAMSPDGKFMLFASDMPGGKGGKDIWMTQYDKKAKTWGTPTNVGGGVNTAGDEMFPYVRENGDLYFSSNGHVGMGGLDLFKSTMSGEGAWEGAENLQFPMNSPWHDYGVIFNGDENRGYFTSNRDGGKGNDDIYRFREPPVLFALQCIVYDKDTRKPVVNARVKVVGTDNSSYEVQTDENGGFNFELNGEDRYIQGNTTYSINVDKQDFLVAKDQISTVGVEESTTYIKEFYIQYATVDVVIKLPEVRYALGKAELQIIEGEVNSQDSLAMLFSTLIENPTINVELQAHTDYRGSATFNRKLSQRRAQSCVDYLVSKGIPAERMTAKGYGEDSPRKGLSKSEIDAMGTKEEQEAAHQKNRRTEFKVLNFQHAPANNWGVSPGFEKAAEDFLKGGGSNSAPAPGTEGADGGTEGQ